MPPPTFRELTDTECQALLDRNHVGRIAYTFKDRVGIEPIGYVSEPGHIYIRTAPGNRLTTIQHHPWVAFEVDEVEGPFDWQSVVVHGTSMILKPEGNKYDQAAYARAVDLLRNATPEMFADEDPAPFRNVIIMIYVDTVTGRAASTT